jgi:hypothetical protein
VNVDLSYMKYAFRIVNIIIILVRIGLLWFLSSIDIKVTHANLASLSAVPIFLLILFNFCSFADFFYKFLQPVDYLF